MPRISYHFLEPAMDDAVARFGLTSHEFYLLHALTLYDRVKYESFAPYAAGDAKAALSDTTVPEQQLAESLQSLVAKGVVQQITEAALADLHAALARDGFSERDVLLGMPRVGDADLTRLGADLYVRAYEALIDPEGPECSAVLDEESDHPTLVSTGFGRVERMVYDFARRMQSRRITKVDASEYGGKRLFRWWRLHDCRSIRLTVERIVDAAST